jgi:hypothetical protein
MQCTGGFAASALGRGNVFNALRRQVAWRGSEDRPEGAQQCVAAQTRRGNSHSPGFKERRYTSGLTVIIIEILISGRCSWELLTTG